MSAERIPDCAALHPGYELPGGLLGSDVLAFHSCGGPLVRASSWEPTAECLRTAGCRVQVPDILAHHPSPPSWRAWTSHLLAHIAGADEAMVVGHSSASVLAADLATRLPARGIILVDGEVPPSQGAAFPVRPALHDVIKGLAEPDGMLPIWSRWFAGDTQRMSRLGLDILARDAAAFARFETGLPRMHVRWFDDAIELADWGYIPAGFIQTSAIYHHAMVAAQRRGWPVANLQGTHLHPTLHPAETANAILAMSRQLDAGPPRQGSRSQ